MSKKKRQYQTHLTWDSPEQFAEIKTAAKKEIEPATAFVKKAAVKRAREVNAKPYPEGKEDKDK